MSDIFRLMVISAAAAICGLVIKKRQPELAMLLTVCAGVIILLLCSGVIAATADFIKKLIEGGGMSDELFLPVLKVTATMSLTRISAEVCRDAKENALAQIVEIAGSSIAVFAMVPLMSSVLDLMSELL